VRTPRIGVHVALVRPVTRAALLLLHPRLGLVIQVVIQVVDVEAEPEPAEIIIIVHLSSHGSGSPGLSLVHHAPAEALEAAHGRAASAA